VERIIEITNLIKTFPNGDFKAVDGLNLEVKKGEVFGLLGPNGAGKTTTISILCGLITPSHGDVIIHNHSLSSGLEEVKKIIGVVPQEMALYPALTAKENLRFFGKLYGLKGLELDAKIDDWLDKFGLKHKANKRVSTFSGGMQRRVNLIAGLLHDPKILFLDEPTVGIDVQSRNVIVEHLKEINLNKGITIIYTSHHMDEAEHLCNKIAIIDNGKKISEGSPAELLATHEGCSKLEDIFLKLTGRTLRD
jgi:ABC-2 type transport system ATP-binding protein